MEIHRGIRVLPGRPVVYLTDYDTLVVSDLHLGFEESAMSEGLFLPKIQFTKISNCIIESIKDTGASRVILNGDIKNDFSKLTRQERGEIRELVAKIRSNDCEIVFVRGNHDNYLGIIASALSIGYVDSLQLGEILVIHGHQEIGEKLDDVDTIIIGHEHPSISIRDDVGYVAKFSCLVKMPLAIGKTLIVLPALSVYMAGNNISLDKENYLSPIIRKFGLINEAIPFIVDEDIGVFELPKLSLLMPSLKV